MRLSRVELDIFREFRRNVVLRVDGVHWAHVHTCHAINAILRVNHDLVVQFVEAGDGTHLHTVGELASVTFVSHDVGHGSAWFESCVKRLLLAPQVIGDARAVNSCFNIALSHAWTIFTAGPEKNRYRESDEVAKATR